jgi:hypothetical protein
MKGLEGVQHRIPQDAEGLGGRNAERSSRAVVIPRSGHRYAGRAADERIEFVVEFPGGR